MKKAAWLLVIYTLIGHVEGPVYFWNLSDCVAAIAQGEGTQCLPN